MPPGSVEAWLSVPRLAASSRVGTIMPLARFREQLDCRHRALSAHSTSKERAVPKQTREGSERTDLPPTRAAALRKWLRVANSRLLLLEHHRQQLLALATTLADALGQRSSRPAFLRGAAAALPESVRERRCQGEKLLAVVFEQQEPRVRDPQPFPQRGGAGGRQISALGALARLFRHGAFLGG